MRRALVLLALLACLTGAQQPASQPAIPWFLSAEFMQDAEHAANISAAKARAAKLDEKSIDQLVRTATLPNRSESDYWTLLVLQDRAVPAMVRALSDPVVLEIKAPVASAPTYK